MSVEQQQGAFEDSYTQPYGSAYFISVDPIFEDQITEAVTLIARSRPDNVRVSYISQFAAAAKAASPTPVEADESEDNNEVQEKKEVEQDSDETKQAKRKVIRDLLSSIKGLRLEATDKEFEGFANLLLSLILSLFPSTDVDFPTLILILSDALLYSSSSERTANPSLSARYASLAILFNSLPTSSAPSLRLTVLLKLITYASTNDDFPVIAPALARLESWLLEWGFGPGTPGEEEGNAAVASVVNSLVAKSKHAQARELLIAHLSAPSAVQGKAATPSASAAKLASQLITISLSLPTIYDFSSLSSIPCISSPSTPELATLLTIFQTGDVAAFEQFVQSQSNQSVLEEHKLVAEQLETKLKLLALAELCSKKVGETVSYAEINEALKLKAGVEDDGEEVETWVIDAIRASLISGRLSQSLATLHVTRAAPRAFTSEHWALLASRLQGWRSSLDAILESVAKGVNVNGGDGVGAMQVRNEKEEEEEKEE